MASGARLKISYAEFLKRADGHRPAEWVQGAIVPMAPASPRHQALLGYLLALLRIYAAMRHPGEVRSAPFQMKTGPDLPGRAPDLLFVAAPNLARLGETFLDGPADLAVEIVTPESRALDRGDKFDEYEQGGVSEYWLLDPEFARAEWYQLGPSGSYSPTLPDAQGRYHSAALPGLWLHADWLWQASPPSLLEVVKAWGMA